MMDIWSRRAWVICSHMHTVVKVDCCKHMVSLLCCDLDWQDRLNFAEQRRWPEVLWGLCRHVLGSAHSHHLGVGVPLIDSSIGAQEVKIALIVDVPSMHALPTGKHHRKRGVVVCSVSIFSVDILRNVHTVSSVALGKPASSGTLLLHIAYLLLQGGRRFARVVVYCNLGQSAQPAASLPS